MNLEDVDLLELQPQFMKNDSTTQALCKVLNPYLKKLSQEIKKALLYERLDELDHKELDELAWQFSADFYDASLGLTQKRAIIKNAIRWHKIKGTPKAVVEAATTIFGRTKLEEWFEYGGKPYFFRLNIDVSKQGTSKSNLEKLEYLIKKYKNVRSWIEKINIFLTNYGDILVGACSVCGEEIIVYPWQSKEISSKGLIKIAILHNTEIESISIYPKKEAQ